MLEFGGDGFAEVERWAASCPALFCAEDEEENDEVLCCWPGKVGRAEFRLASLSFVDGNVTCEGR
jgi:hypothetical protein